MAVAERAALNQISPYKTARSRESIEREYGISHLIKLAGNENRLGCSEEAEKAVLAYIRDPELRSLYPDGNVTLLRDALAALHGLSGDQFIFGNGSFELISVIARTFLEEGSESIYSVPSFNWYKNVTLQAGARPVEIPLKDFTTDLDAIQRAVTVRTKVIWLCNPNNPTGTVFKARRFLRFLEEVRKDILIVLDEAYLDYMDDSQYLSQIRTQALVQRFDNLIALRTFSKLYGLAGYRIGYGFGDAGLIAKLQKGSVPICVSALAQTAALASLKDTGFARAVRENNRKGLDLYYKALDDAGLDYIESHANFILFDTKRPSEAAVSACLRHGILIRGGAEFGLPTYVRVTIGTEADNRKVLSILKEEVVQGAEA